MARDTSPKLKRARSLGVPTSYLGINKKSIRRPKRSRRKLSNYGIQLREKQKVKFIYGILEKQFLGYYKKAEKMRGVTGDNMLSLLERRLDNVIFRMNVAKTRPQARQMVSHGLFKVNGVRVDIPSYLVKAEDIICVVESKKSKKPFEELKENKMLGLPEWVEFDGETLCGKIVRLPERDDIKEEISENLIIELYSK